MDTKLDSRQGQFPATFPDAFKDFFSMMSEDEDSLDLFSNLLEDKVIPRSQRYTQRRCGGSFRCTNTTPNNFGRSHSFRVNRPTGSYCKHIKYCCLHQKQYSHNVIDYSTQNEAQDDEVSQKSKSPRSSLVEQVFESESYDGSDTISTSSSTIPNIHYNSIGRQQSKQSKAFNSKGSLPRIPTSQCGLRETVSGATSGSGAGACSTSPSPGGPSAGVGSIACSSGRSASISAGIGVSTFPGLAVSSNSSIAGGGGGSSSAGRPSKSVYSDINASSPMSSTSVSMTKCLSDKLNCCSRATNLRTQKSPIPNRRRSSSIAATLLASDNKIFRNSDDPPSWTHNIPHSSTRERLSHVKSPINSTTVHALFKEKTSNAESVTLPFPKQSGSHGMISSKLPSVSSSETNCMAVTPTGTAKGPAFTGSSVTIAQAFGKQRQRMRTSSMPAENRKPRLADTRRAAIHCADMDIEYYRLRSFSITSHGICNLGDSMRSRRSRSINSVTSTGTSNSGRERNSSNASRTSGDFTFEKRQLDDSEGPIPAYKIAMLGASGVGKTALTYQFTTSDYICAYDLSLDDDYGQKTVSILLDGIETDLEIIDHPACEMSTEAFCSTYNIDLFVVVYSVVDRNSFKAAEKVLQYLKESEMLLTRGAILVGNKTDLERHREVPRQMGRRIAKEIGCKFIETSSGLDHNVDELLVGIVAQVKLNTQRIHNLSERERQRLQLNNTIQKHRRIENPTRKIVKQNSVCKDFETTSTKGGKTVKKSAKRVLNLENILKVGESEVDDDDDDSGPGTASTTTASYRGRVSRSERPSCSSTPNKRNSYENLAEDQNITNLVIDSKEKTMSRLSNRTKIFLASILKFKKNIRTKRRNSSSCSDLFVI